MSIRTETTATMKDCDAATDFPMMGGRLSTLDMTPD
jgi:hypothetical protein